MMTKTYGYFVELLGVVLIATSSSASANPENITDAEMALLPRYCPYTQSFSKHGAPEVSRWVNAMGKDFTHMHHYCWGLIHLGRSERATLSSAKRRSDREEAILNFRYVIKTVSADFILLPEVLTRLGRTYLLNHEPTKGEQSFAKARALKLDYWPAYFHWAEYLLSVGQKSEALEIIKSGLQHSPDAKPLNALFSKLGGKPSDIPPPLKKEALAPDESGPQENGSGTR